MEEECGTSAVLLFGRLTTDLLPSSIVHDCLTSPRTGSMADDEAGRNASSSATSIDYTTYSWQQGIPSDLLLSSFVTSLVLQIMYL